MQAFDGLAIELLKHGYRHYLLAAVYCPDHGEFRIGDPHIADDLYKCPQCGKACHCVVLGRELSRREIPFADFVRHIRPACDRHPGSARYGDEYRDENDDIAACAQRERERKWKITRPGHGGARVGGYKRREPVIQQVAAAVPL